jgi:hypothetical protein
MISVGSKWLRIGTIGRLLNSVIRQFLSREVQCQIINCQSSLKLETHPGDIYKFCSYLTENTPAPLTKNSSLMLFILWSKCRVFNV